jgi:hypothetical protein
MLPVPLRQRVFFLQEDLRGTGIMPNNKAHVRRFTQLVQAESKTMARWLRQTAKDRSTRPVNDRLDMILWSWPIRPALSKRPPSPLWKGKKDEAVLTHLTDLAETVYPDMWYPAAVYSMEWAPWNSPLNMRGDDFKDMCHNICEQLRSLSSVAVSDPHDDLLWLCLLLEHGWGDRQRDYRQQLQNSVVKDLTGPVHRQVCEIGERARDAAYHHVRISRCLDTQRKDKEHAMQFKAWLRDTKLHAPFVEAHLPRDAGPHATPLKKALIAFTAAFQVMEAEQNRVTQYVNEYMADTFDDPGRDRRAKVGPPSRALWVDPANCELKRLKIREEDRRALLMAWGLVPVERGILPGS